MMKKLLMKTGAMSAKPVGQNLKGRERKKKVINRRGRRSSEWRKEFQRLDLRLKERPRI
jgi:hypothetical protein